jgi:hypothetical protein
MTNQAPSESDELRMARTAWLESIDKYKQEVGLATDPLQSIEDRLEPVSTATQNLLISTIHHLRDAYYEALKVEGRPVPHLKS